MRRSGADRRARAGVSSSLPILVIVPLSFSSGSFFYYPLPGFSLRWYADFFTSAFWLPSLSEQPARRHVGDACSRRCSARSPRSACGARASRAGACCSRC